MSQSRKRILVTGGAGFLGSHLCEALLEQGHDVFCIDNFSTGRRENIARLTTSPRFTVIHHDISFPIFFEADEIYNLASLAHGAGQDPIKVAKTSVSGAINMLALAKKSQAKILQASTSLVYGEPEIFPQSESYAGHLNPVSPEACYGESKRCAETFFFDYHREYGIKIKIARIFDTYGPRLPTFSPLSHIILNALQRKPITLTNSFERRSFCFVSDVVRGLIALMESDSSITGPINLGSPEAHTLFELAEIILDATHSPSSIHALSHKDGPPREFRPDIHLAKNLLHWQPEVPLKVGLRETIYYFNGLSSL